MPWAGARERRGGGNQLLWAGTRGRGGAAAVSRSGESGCVAAAVTHNRYLI